MSDSKATIVNDMSLKYFIVELPAPVTRDQRKQIAERIAAALENPTPEPRVAQFSKRRPMLEESDAWASAEDERDWWRNYALQIERAATPPRVGINGAGSILGCTCEMCEFHRSAEAIERQRRATSTKPVESAEPTYECIDEQCGWVGLKGETVHLKHDPNSLRCPECHEAVELDQP